MMQATNSFKSTLVVLAATLLVLSFAVQFIAGQACTSQAGLKPTTAAYFCPIGYVNTKVTDLVGGVTYECRKVNDMISPITKGKACRTAIDCMVTTQDDPNVYSTKLYSQCSNGRCVRASTRLPGDNCEWGSQCLGGRCDMSTKKCISSALYTAKQGDRCEVGFDGNTIYCESGTSQSLKCVPEVVTLGTQTNTFKFCYAKNTVTVGKTCTTTNNATKTYDTCEDFSRMFCNSTLGLCVEKLADGSFCNAHSQCKSGDCVRSDLTDPWTATCKTLKTAGATCQSALECTNSLTCRSTVAKASRVCTTPAALGDYCAADSDCFFNSGFTFGGSVISTELVVCANQRCVRQNGVINGQKCEKDANCHSGYCDISGGVCKVAPALTCDGKNTDGKCPSCACTSGENSAGVCLHNVATNCPGYLLDLQVCVYNNFVNSLTDPLISNYFLLARSNVDSPFLDTDSTLYKTCGPYYNNLMKCLYSGNLDKWTPAEIDGFSFTGTATPNVMLPKVISGAGSITSSLVMLALVVLSFLLF